MASGISFGHFNIVGGAVREDGPYVAVLEDRTPAESVADLYLVVEPAAPGSEQVCADLLALAERHFGRPQYSLTGNLLQTLRAMQEHLRAWNKTAQPADRVAAGCSCLAISGSHAYLAQAGPGVAYVRHGGRLQRQETLEPDAQAPLGTRIACAPAFSHFQLAQGDTLLLSSSRFATLADNRSADRILSLPPGDALPEIFSIARGEKEFSALYLAVTGELAGESAPASEAGARGRRTGRTADPEGDAGSESALLEERGGRNGGWWERPPRSSDQSRLASRAGAPTPESGASPTIDTQPSLDAETRRRHLQRLNERRSLLPPKPVLYTFVAVLALGLAGWFGLPHLLQTGRTDQSTGLLRQARARIAAASAAHDPAQVRSDLEKAQADLAEVKLLRPQDPSLPALQAQAGTALDALNAIKQLPAPKTLLDMTMTQILPRSVSDFVAAGQLYLLDASTGTVYTVNPRAQQIVATPIFAAGKLIEGITTAAAQHLAWQPADTGKPGILYILDANRRLFSYDVSGSFRSVGLTGTDRWKSATSIAAASGSLYVLDAGSNQIWHYTLTPSGFTSGPEAMVSKIDLHDAVQIAAAGDLYVSTQGGRLLRLSGGREQEVHLSGIDHPLLSPQTPLADPTTGLLYIADAGNQRVVVAASGDTFRQQYTGAALHGLRAAAFDASSGTLYTLSEQSLIASQLR